ncbi:MAG: aldehyde dehydrogenase (NADP(+)) [Acidobacteriota bacterium]|nr:aldehyde dehydrogenase (NADP(+)) [Acidobacteriota bacterium]
MTAVAAVLVAGSWRASHSNRSFQAENPVTGTKLDDLFPVSGWADCDAALEAATAAAQQLRHTPPEVIARFLELYASELEAHADALLATANVETGLPVSPRLKDVELPRTTTQLRQGAAAAREGSWRQIVIDRKANIRSYYAGLGPVVVFGPNNFPFAFNGVAGGDMVAAVAAGNPVIAKAHPLHPATSRLLAECAYAAMQQSGVPMATVQMLYHLDNEDGLRLVSDPRVAAIAFTGSRKGGLHLKAAAERVGKPIYLEMSSLNPIVLLPGALQEKGAQLATELADSCLAGAGQFCTSPNLILTLAGEDAEQLARAYAEQMEKRPSGTLLSTGGLSGLDANVRALVAAGAEVVTGGKPLDGPRYCYSNTLLRVTGAQFLENAEALQVEAFGNATTLVTAADAAQLIEVLQHLEGNLTACVYSSSDSTDDALYRDVAEVLRTKAGRLLNDKMPTGVALSPAMNHGGPYPATGHPGFTAVGIPRSLLRFAALQCFDNVRPHRLPAELRDDAPHAEIWRQIDGAWVKG